MTDKIHNLLDRTANGLEIENLVTAENLTYMEAVIQWMEENSLDITPANCNKYIPKALVEKLSQECINANMLRPSAIKSMTRNTLDFLM
ncbi:late promoter transcriptional regulator [Aeromonas phage GomatiRiver_11]|nr:RNA polymerase-associated protein [Aeromonas phage AhFM11]WKW84202.1 late promoter transcriptional regulator [Aeromonas phage GomatiRiver_11]